MLEILLLANLAMSAELSPYATRSAHAFLAVANDRIIDGASYTNRNGVLSAGALYADPSGFFAHTELDAFEGSGTLLPGERVLSLESVAGWQLERGTTVFSAALLDYRLEIDGASVPDHQGASFGFRRGSLGMEFAIEPDRMYYYRQYDAFYPHASRRLVASWSEPVSADVRWSIALGATHVEPRGYRRHFATAGLLWRWHRFDWEAVVTHSPDNRDSPWAGEAAGTALLLRVSRPVQLVP